VKLINQLFSTETRLPLREFNLVGIHFGNNANEGHFLLHVCISVFLCWKCEVWLVIYILSTFTATHHYYGHAIRDDRMSSTNVTSRTDVHIDESDVQVTVHHDKFL